ncbi:signal peptide peptidase SppA [Vreelandella boliviensis]|uniref:Na(+)/H(+) antiporter nhaA n=1 Tax=Vreelandella boliviensis LC1 TaxID=1072583 RepID=A0A265DXE1_9GAMM|nr:signal peptide peptidase SppA [Halomonas boliviensis]EHJ91383.1 Na(+)/H(+) antiporter nhaA [Halomonas boliviensis LC1]OZT73983.1 signal peptide peptidase SppA [Halomonas boliviensis LC1]
MSDDPTRPGGTQDGHDGLADGYRRNDADRNDSVNGDQRNELNKDPWTEGSELPPGKGAQQSSGALGDDAETLRERQRLAQLEMMDHWIGGVLTEQRRNRRWKLFFRLMFLAVVLVALFAALYSLFWGSPSATAPTQRHLGIVEVNGVIASDSPANAERIILGLNRAWEAESAAAVVLHINSPGGSPVQSQRIYAEIMRLRGQGDKPIIAVIEDVGASGAYYIAAAADEIVASPVSLVGSIGVIYAGFGFEEALERIGVERRVLTAGENKAFLDPFQPLDDEDEQFWQGVLSQTHRQFIDDVRAGRGERLSDSSEIFSGLIWSGEQSIELGLVDQLGSLEQLARDQVGGTHWVDYTPSLDPFERFTRRFTQVVAEVMGVNAPNTPLRF